MATGDAALTLMRDTLYSIIMVSRGLVGFSRCWAGGKFATQYMNLFGVVVSYRAVSAGDYCAGFPMALPQTEISLPVRHYWSR